jgi:hypothetical protein
MRIFKAVAAAALGIAAVGLTACATTLDTRVTRYQAMPAPQGQTFAVVPDGGMAANGGLEFQRYAAIVAQQLTARGFTPAASPESATMLVQLGYGVDHGQTRIASNPFYGPYGGPFGGGFFYPRFGFWHSPFAFGWDDPFWYGGGVDSYVEYHSQLELHIRQHGTNAPLFDGRVQARSQSNRLDVVLPALIQAIFTGFPGQNGETVKITIPTRPTSGQTASY